MLPRHGTVYGIFLLAHVAKSAPRQSLTDWVNAARARSSYLAAAVNLQEPAHSLVELKLAKIERQVMLAPPLVALSETADRATLIGIARVLLTVSPPAWLALSITNHRVAREYIPSDDLRALEWLDPELDQVLIDVSEQLIEGKTDDLKKKFGDAGELFIMAALSDAGLRPLHVAKISDAYGYDIEVRIGAIHRIEVKTASTNTARSFRLTRNEFEKSRLYGDQWRLIQLVFKSSALLADRLDITHVEEILELQAGALLSIVPPDTQHFVWKDSGVVTPEPAMWRPAKIVLDPEFSMPGFKLNGIR